MTVADELAQGCLLWDTLGGYFNVTSFRFGVALDLDASGRWARVGVAVAVSSGPWTLTLKRSPDPRHGGPVLGRLRPGSRLYLATFPNLVTVPSHLTYEPVSHGVFSVGRVSEVSGEAWQPHARERGEVKPLPVALEVLTVSGLRVLSVPCPSVTWGSQGAQTPRGTVHIRGESGRGSGGGVR